MTAKKQTFVIKSFHPVFIKENNYDIPICLYCRNNLNDYAVDFKPSFVGDKNNIVCIDNNYYHKLCHNKISNSK
jgi:hypothetical protein